MQISAKVYPLSYKEQVILLGITSRSLESSSQASAIPVAVQWRKYAFHPENKHYSRTDWEE